MKRLLKLAIVFGCAALTCGFVAQVPNEGMANKIVESRKANAALMKQYTWNSRMELIKEDKTLDIKIEQVQYGPDGNLMRTELNNESFSHPRGFLRKHIAEEKKKELEKYMKGLRELLDEYTLPTAGKIVDFMAGANVTFVKSPDDRAQMLMIAGTGVVKPGDSLTIWAAASDQKMKKVQIATTFEGGTVNMTANYRTNAGGLTYMSMAEVDIPDKNLTLMIHNYDYEKND